jgi:hypothetical protein
MAASKRLKKLIAMVEPKRLLRVALYREGHATVQICAAISYEGEIWLIPDWIRSPRGRSAKPLRMIPLSKFPHKVFPQTQEAYADYGIDGLVPKALFDPGVSAPLSPVFGVLERPDLKIPIGQLMCYGAEGSTYPRIDKP